jgi:histidyl-tRNA synthetase
MFKMAMIKKINFLSNSNKNLKDESQNRQTKKKLYVIVHKVHYARDCKKNAGHIIDACKRTCANAEITLITRWKK